ncbi:magnesium chelatase subunit H [Aurantimonas sp. VKM B-3413]|uniref:magnesium chelatase subunit H n=1 Tax=Aurantimonas sp. VKM B-3413 TaxID=2779401 RepID=UPI001E562865|nr:magnesium chelatase subunit H [Aurantimonas sp. VKM B-3413]MCB8839083.1 magnesium chelatase subunit H [Aurantimonas sp. VKM B-3413]
MQKPITAGDRAGSGARGSVPVRVVLISLDGHMAGAVASARTRLRQEIPGLEVVLHAATDWEREPEALAVCLDDIARGDIVFANMLFMENHIQPVLPALQARRDHCDAMVGAMSAGEVIKLTRLGGFEMAAEAKGVMALLKRLRGGPKSSGRPATGSGARQMAMLRRLPKILRFIPGTAQDVRAYFLTLQYWLAGSDENVANMIRFLVQRYAAGPRAEAVARLVKTQEPVVYPDVGLYHPRLPDRIATRVETLPNRKGGAAGTVGLLVMRSYVLSGDTGHYDGVIAAMEAKGLKVIPAFASGLDSRPAIDAFFRRDGKPVVDALVSLTGFSLVGGPAYNDSRAAETALAELDVPFLSAHAVEFQSLGEWAASSAGLTPVEATMMVAIPEIDGATGPTLFGGRTALPRGDGHREMTADLERAGMLARRVEKLIALRRRPKAERAIALTIFNFPPNAGAVGTAAHLSVFASLFNTLKALKADGYAIDLPASVDALRAALLEGNAARHGAQANVHARISADDHVRREPHLAEIEAQWGPAPGRQQSDGSSIFVLGAKFGNAFVGIQPAFGYEGDPMRLLFEKGFAPTHAFSAYYRWLREDFGADAVLHFGTHGALEFMPGKQVGLSGACWPDRLIQDLPNVYLYAANNPSEGTIAKRRAAAVLVSYLTPPVAHAGLYRGLADLKATIERWRASAPEAFAERRDLEATIAAQAAALDLCEMPEEGTKAAIDVPALHHAVLEVETTLIPHGLHVVGQPVSDAERADLVAAAAEVSLGAVPAEGAIAALVGGDRGAALSAKDTDPAADDPAQHEKIAALVKLEEDLRQDFELPALLRALDGRFIRPVAGGDLLRNPEIVPTGRNVHGFDPFRIPSAFAVKDGWCQAERMLARHAAGGHGLPESVALVLWGTDNLKSEGGPLAQALALIGAAPRFDGFGRLCGADLLTLDSLGRPRIDVLITLSGIFRDLLPLQSRLLAEAAFLAASAEEPEEQNFVRKHALAYAAETGCDLETAALRVFSNADGAYGSNVNMLVDSGAWEAEGELAAAYTRRKCFAVDRKGRTAEQAALLKASFAKVEMTYQNLESVELGVTTIDHYFDTLGGISRAASEARGEKVPVYIGDQTRGEGKVRTLEEQVALETRTRMLNPKWIEAMLAHGYEGVRQIESHVTNTLGWSATTGQVSPWVYKRLAETFVLDPEMRERLASLNPTASARMADRLIEAEERHYWKSDAADLEALREAGADLEDRLEGVKTMEAAA